MRITLAGSMQVDRSLVKANIRATRIILINFYLDLGSQLARVVARRRLPVLCRGPQIQCMLVMPQPWYGNLPCAQASGCGRRKLRQVELGIQILCIVLCLFWRRALRLCLPVDCTCRCKSSALLQLWVWLFCPIHKLVGSPLAPKHCRFRSRLSESSQVSPSARSQL